MTAQTGEHAGEDTTEDTGEYTAPPEDTRRESQRVITLPVTAAQTILHALRLADEFLRQAGPATRAELRAFCTARGWTPACGTGAFIDTIGFSALTLHHAITTTADHTGTDHTSTDKETA